MAETSASALKTLEDLAQRRRTCLRLDLERPVEPELVKRLCQLAVWAPNHHRTEPWRFAVLTGRGRERFGNAIADIMESAGEAEHRVTKTRTKYLRARTVLVVGSVKGATPTETEENRLATAAAIQTLLLGATAAGLHSYWGSVTTPDAEAVLEVCGFELGTTLIAAIYLGHPARDCAPGSRNAPLINWIEG
jgi:nitroreductase